MNLTQYEKQPLQDHCGIFAALAQTNIHFFSRGVAALRKLQTRGYDGAGFGTIDHTKKAFIYKREGLVDRVFTPRVIKKFEKLQAQLWLFQVRYGTVGAFSKRNIQPFLRRHLRTKEPFIVIHNGQFSADADYNLKDDSDSLQFVRQLSRSREHTWDARLKNLLRKKRGAWSIAIGTKDALYLARDLMGIRPLIYGSITSRGETVWVAASETSALMEAGVTHFFEVLPGQLVRIDKDGPVVVDSIKPRPALCIFENVYLMKGDGKAHLPRNKKEEINDAPLVDDVRARSGAILAKESPLLKKDVDFAVGIPGTGIAGGEAYAKTLGLPYHQAVTDRVPQDDQRTFMQADIDTIYRSVLHHFNFNEKLFVGKRVVLIDDSLVRGNVTRGLVDLLKKKYQTKEVHLRILCPPIDKICYLGINTRQRRELLAAQIEKEIKGPKTLESLVAAMKNYLGADSLAFITAAGLRSASSDKSGDTRFCMGCMFGHLPPITRAGNFRKK